MKTNPSEFPIGATVRCMEDARNIGGTVHAVCTGTVSRRTRTQIIIKNQHGNEMRYRLSDGSIIGAGTFPAWVELSEGSRLRMIADAGGSAAHKAKKANALPDLEIFQWTAEEYAAQDEELIAEFMKRREFRFAGFNSRDREAMLAAIVEETKITGGWFWWSCFPGCMPDGPANGPFESSALALADAQGGAS